MTSYDAAMTRSKRELARQLVGANDRIEALEKECFALAANQCNHGFGDEFGHFRCARIEALEAALRKIAEWPPSSRVDDIINAFIDAKLFARAALAPEQDK
jgi:hypothetical protein